MRLDQWESSLENERTRCGLSNVIPDVAFVYLVNQTVVA